MLRARRRGREGRPMERKEGRNQRGRKPCAHLATPTHPGSPPRGDAPPRPSPSTGSAPLGNFRHANRTYFRRPRPDGLYVCQRGAHARRRPPSYVVSRPPSPLASFPLPPQPAQRPPPALREETGPGGGQTRRQGGRDRPAGKKGRGRGTRGRRTRRGAAEEEWVPPVIKGEETEGEGRACGAEPPSETARHRGRRERGCLAGSPFLSPSF